MNRGKKDNHQTVMVEEREARYWISGLLIEKIPLIVHGEPQDLSLVWADGMVGVLPVFESEEAARKYRDNLSGDGALIAIKVTRKRP